MTSAMWQLGFAGGMRACKSCLRKVDFLAVHRLNGKDNRNGMRMLATAVVRPAQPKKKAAPEEPLSRRIGTAAA